MGFGDLRSEAGLKSLNDYLADRSYVEGSVVLVLYVCEQFYILRVHLLDTYHRKLMSLCSMKWAPLLALSL